MLGSNSKREQYRCMHLLPWYMYSFLYRSSFYFHSAFWWHIYWSVFPELLPWWHQPPAAYNLTLIQFALVLRNQWNLIKSRITKLINAIALRDRGYTRICGSRKSDHFSVFLTPEQHFIFIVEISGKIMEIHQTEPSGAQIEHLWWGWEWWCLRKDLKQITEVILQRQGFFPTELAEVNPHHERNPKNHTTFTLHQSSVRSPEAKWG